MGKPIDPELAEKIFRNAGLEPLVDFPGTRYRWKSRCTKCNRVVTPFFSSVAYKGNGGCNDCGQERAYASKTLTDASKAQRILDLKGLVLISEYRGVKETSTLECSTCQREYRTTIESFRAKRLCICKKDYKAPSNPLSESDPELSQEWHPKRNGRLTPMLVSRGSKRRVSWLCREGHEWSALVYARARGNGCPYCSGRNVIPGETDVLSAGGLMAIEWHPGLNHGVDPRGVHSGSQSKFWWRCSKNETHEWSATPAKRRAGRGCPFCARDNFKPGVNDLESARPDLLKDWDFERNEVHPSKVAVFSSENFHWIGDCGHPWTQKLSNRTRGQGCTVCTSKVVVPGENDFATWEPTLAQYFHPTLNALGPEAFSKVSGQRVWWFCDFGHEYEATIASKVGRPLNCPVCLNRKLMIGVNDLFTSDKELASLWDQSRNGDLRPEDIGRWARQKVWWICRRGHSFESEVRAMHLEKCPYCSGRFPIKGETDLETVSEELAAQWHHELNDRAPSEVTLGSDYKAWWRDSLGHVWYQAVQVRSRGVGCPDCAQTGYMATRPGKLYFIRNRSLNALKVGITNTDAKTDRVANFKAQGWELVRSWISDDGYAIRKAETLFFRWLRGEKGIPPFLSVYEMPRTGGWSETFEMDDSLMEESRQMLETLVA